MQEACGDIEDCSELVFFDGGDDLLHGGKERKLRGAADYQARMPRYFIYDGLVGFPVDTKGLFAEQVLARSEYVDIELLVQVVWNGAIDGVYVAALKEFSVVGGTQCYGIEVRRKPGSCSFVLVADGDDLRNEIQIEKVAPAGRGACELASHQSAADYSKPNLLLLHGR